MPPFLDTLDTFAESYSVILSDVWGVLHNGLRSFPEAAAALTRMRARGKAVILVTNAPRPHDSIAGQLGALDVPQTAWDAIVSSGDVTRKLIAEASRRVHHIGPDRDLVIYDGLDVELVEWFEASTVVCTGLFDDDEETPEDYAETLRNLRGRNLPFICANPDIVVERGERLVWCAGALARDYARLGGRTLIAGKPHRPIYEAALAAASETLGRPIANSEVLAVGDGVLTDVKGAVDNGFDLLFVTAGIHAHEYGTPEVPDAARVEAFLAGHGYAAAAAIPRLR